MWFFLGPTQEVPIAAGVAFLGPTQEVPIAFLLYTVQTSISKTV